MGLSSCLCQPRYVSFLHLVEKIDGINTHFYTLQQAPPDSGVLLKETLVKELLGDIFIKLICSDSERKRFKLSC